MQKLRNATTITILALAVPIAALANITGTQTLTSGQIFSFDTGAVVTSGGDILWTGSSITLEGSAKALSGAAYGLTGMSTFNSLVSEGPTALSAFASLLSSSPIPASAIAVGNIFAVQTNGGNIAGFIITAQSGTSITIQFVSFVATVPTITQVLNNYSLIPGGFTNSGISPGSLFIVKGSLLASATSVTSLQSSAAPGLPNTLNGASVKVTVGSVTTVPVFYYAEAAQLALVLPSNTPAGAGTVTVTYNNQTSAPFNIEVVATAMGFDTYSGLGVATNAATGVLYTYTNSIPPGTTVVLWGSGLGADPARDTTYVPAAFSINNLSAIYVGGVAATIGYQGASGYPGVNQVNVTIPANAPTGCNVSLVGVSTTGVPTNFITLPIGGGICQDPGLGTNGTTLTSITSQTSFSIGGVELFQSTSPATSGGGTQTTTTASAIFASYSGFTASASGGYLSIGSCIVSEALVATGSIGTITGLNAGTITVTGPSGSVALTSEATLFPNTPSLSGYYATIDAAGNSTLSAGFIPTSGGTFTFQGTGGTTAPSVGPFTTQIVFPNPLLDWTNQASAATVTRSAGLPITWTGGSPGTYVSITGSSSTAGVSGSFSCYAPVSALQFTVPPYVLAALPASSTGFLSVGNSTPEQTFTATGITYGYAVGGESYQINAKYQ